MERFQKNKLLASYFSVFLSITMVLLIIGFLGLALLKYRSLSKYFKEKIHLLLYLSDDLSPEVELSISDFLKTRAYTNRIRFISKDEAAQEFSKEIGEDFLNFLGKNPLKSYYELGLKSDFVKPSEIVFIKRELLEQNSHIEEIIYDEPLIYLLNKNVKIIGFWMILGVSILCFITFFLLNSLIRLSIYSKRFIIKTMQMVGATKSFIQKPFIIKSIYLGLTSSFFSSLILFFFCYKVDEWIPLLGWSKDIDELFIVIGSVFLLSLTITTMSSFIATRQFLKLKTHQLYS